MKLFALLLLTAERRKQTQKYETRMRHLMGRKRRKSVYTDDNFEILIRNTSQLCFLRFPFPLITNSPSSTLNSFCCFCFMCSTYSVPKTKVYSLVGKTIKQVISPKYDKSRGTTQEPCIKVPLFICLSASFTSRSIQAQYSAGILNGVGEAFCELRWLEEKGIETEGSC